MGAPPKTAKLDAQAAARRRSTRLAIAIPVTISGKDASGHTFKENSRTVIINKHGAKILTVHELVLSSELTVENRALGRGARATVVWVGDKPSPKDPVEIGVQLFQAENIWGIEFPPDDWQEGPPMGPGGQRVESIAAPLPAAPTERVASPVPTPAGPVAPPKPPESPRATAPPIAVPTGPVAAPGVVEATTQASLARLSKQTEEVLEERARQFEERLTKLTQQIGFQAQATLQEAANRHEEKMVQEIEQETAGLEQRLQAARADLEAQVTRLQELQQAAQEEIEKTQRNIQTASFAALQAATEELNEKLRTQIESVCANFIEETLRRVEHTAAVAVETFHQQATARLGLEDLQRKLDDMLARFQAQLDKDVLEAQQRALKQSLDGLQKQAADTSLLLTDEVRACGKATVEEARKQLATLTRGTLETVSKDTRAAQLSAAALEAAGKAAVEGTREKLALLSAETLEALTEEAKSLAREYPVQVRKTLQEFQDQRTRELEDHLQKALEKQRQAVLKQIQKVGEDTANQAVTQLKTKSEQVINEVADGLTKSLGEKVQQRSEDLVQDFQSRLEQAARSVQERSVKEIEERIRELTLKQIEESDAELDKRAAENLELVTEQLKERQEQTIEEATELFRRTIAQMFAALQLGPKKPPEGEGPKKRH